MFVRDLLHGFPTNLGEIAHVGPLWVRDTMFNNLSVFAGDSQAGNTFGNALAFYTLNAIN